MFKELREEIAFNLAEVKSSFFAYKERGIKLVAVTKGQSLEKLRVLYDLGCRDFGENYLQELEKKNELFPDVVWHYLGGIQSNKIKKIVLLSEVIHSLASIKHIEKIDKVAFGLNKRIKGYLQINFSEEEHRNGICVSELMEVLEYAKRKENLRIVGLMVMTGKEQSVKEKGKVFEEINCLKNKYKEKYPFLQSLSMGMSSDYLLALKYGSDCVRLGERLLGKRTRYDT